MLFTLVLSGIIKTVRLLYKTLNVFRMTIKMSFHDIYSDESDCEDESPVPSLAAKNYVSTIQRTGAIWILKMRESYLLPQSTTDNIIKDTDSLYQVCYVTMVTSLIT